ncbi:MAG: FAD-binding oxidoreductase [Emcibacteraceae bacterium]|nr:FAD-binding oxidoreductase [Emcibacteraceae bacterium]MDG1858672.1 FAD-binding oxidoreductase [Emcibacteraceae bacterium]
MADIIDEIAEQYGPKTVVLGKDIGDHASSYWDPTPISAKAIIKPASTEELSDIVKKLNDAEQIIVTHGGLTGCAQAANATLDHVIISTERMNKLIEIDEVGGTITVEAGAILETVQNTVAENGFYYPVDLGARGSCTIGGNAATNAGGINVIRYGMMRNHILGLEAVLADGTILSSMNKVIKNNAGYDLKQLFIGSEGTLGIITRLIVKLDTATKSQETALVALNSFKDVTNFLKHMRENTANNLSAFEVMWGNYYNDVTGEGAHSAPMERGSPFYVITECCGSDPDNDQTNFLNTLETAFEKNIITNAVIPKSHQERRAIWQVREGFEPILENDPIFLYDVSLPIIHMDQYIKSVEKNVATTWPNSKCYVIGHIGDGNLHLFICPKEGDESLHKKSNEIVYGPLKDIGGSVSAEHGIGLEKKSWLAHSRSEVEITLMKSLKRSFDPKNILNPGVIFDLD